jgi:chromosome segregation ATPase
MEENTTILLGVIREQGRDIKRMVQHLETIDDRLDTLDQRLDSLERDMESRFGTLGNRFGTLESHFEAQDKKLDQMLHLLTTLTAKPGQET